MISGISVNPPYAGGTEGGEDRMENMGRASHRYRY